MRKTRLLSTSLSSPKIWRNAPIFNDDVEHTLKIENGVSSLQVRSYNYEADSTITLQACKSRANVPVVFKDRHFDGSYLQSFHVRGIKTMCVKIWQKMLC